MTARKRNSTRWHPKAKRLPKAKGRTVPTGATLDKLIEAALSVLHHDGDEDSPVHKYETEVLRRRFEEILEIEPSISRTHMGRRWARVFSKGEEEAFESMEFWGRPGNTDR
jgi:hypothetical protein